MIGPLMPIASNEKSPPVNQTGNPLPGWQTIEAGALDKIHYLKSAGLNSALRLDNYIALDPDDDDAIQFLSELDREGLLPETVAWNTWRGRIVRLYNMTEKAKRIKPSQGMKLEIRCGNGQYVIIPPSVIAELFPYTWLNSPNKCEVADIPSQTLDIIYKRLNISSHRDDMFEPPLSDISSLWEGVGPGLRNNTATVLAGHLIGRGVPFDQVVSIMSLWNDRNSPPLSKRELIRTISSINASDIRKHLCIGHSISNDISEWIKLNPGVFSINDIYRDLYLTTKIERGEALQVLNQLTKQGILTRSGPHRGQYRIVEDDLTAIDFINANPDNYYPMVWPFGIEKMAHVYPKNVVIIAGSPNSGKTAFVLNVIKSNLGKFPMNYFSSEMGAEELRVRLDKFDDIPLSLWSKCNWYERAENFSDVVDPGAVNIIDFLEISDDFSKVAKDIMNIWKVLDTGVAIICIQKKEGSLLGRGAEFSNEKARLYISLDEIRSANIHKLTIVKAKNWVDRNFNPNNRSIFFKILNSSILQRVDMTGE